MPEGGCERRSDGGRDGKREREGKGGREEEKKDEEEDGTTTKRSTHGQSGRVCVCVCVCVCASERARAWVGGHFKAPEAGEVFHRGLGLPLVHDPALECV